MMKDIQRLEILFTGDLHSHVTPFPETIQGTRMEIGGFARIGAFIANRRQENSQVLVLDCGDFSMGTLLQTIYDREAPELRLLGAMGYDMTMIGNHEFDYHTDGITGMLNAAIASGEHLPSIAICNVDWKQMRKLGLTSEQKKIWQVFQDYGIADYHIIEKDGIRIAITGVLGKDAIECAPTCVLKFKDQAKAVGETVARIQKKETVDMIICISHSGVQDSFSRSEDEKLAKAVPELDLILSGHTHVTRGREILQGRTLIVSPGEYGRFVGQAILVKRDQVWQMEQHRLVPMDETVSPLEELDQKIQKFMEQVDDRYLAEFGYKRQQILATNDVEFCSIKDLEMRHEELNLGSFIADAFVHTVNTIEPEDPVDLALVPAGIIRGTYGIGAVTVEDVYHSFSLGIGPDRRAGYPLIRAFLTGKELKAVAEIDASLSDRMETARLYLSGLHFVFNPGRIFLNKVYDIYLQNGASGRRSLEDDTLYSIVTDLYTANMIRTIKDLSHGVIRILPKNRDGSIMEHLEDGIVREDGRELKAWDGIARYFLSFPDHNGDGYGEVPDYYRQTQSRKVVDTDRSIQKRLSRLNRFGRSILMVGIGTVLFLAGLIVMAIRAIRKKS